VCLCACLSACLPDCHVCLPACRACLHACLSEVEELSVIGKLLCLFATTGNRN
jgi:hypothetical protein